MAGGSSSDVNVNADPIDAQWGALKGSIEARLLLLKEERAQLDKDKESFEDMKKKIASVHFPNTIKLDVGGHRFKTTKATLCKEPSMLASMFSGTGFLVEVDEDGYYFIDRPGAFFAPILHYLQTGTFIAPTNPQKHKAITLEVEFYQIQSLIDILKPKQHICKYENVNDTNGVLYWLGTDRGTTGYTNPVSKGIVTANGSASPVDACSHPSEGRAGDAGWCNSALSKNFTITLPVEVIPTSYSLSFSNYCHRPYTWKLEGAKSDSVWEQLLNHVNDDKLAAGRANWEIPTTQQAYSQFRITCTGRDVGGATCYCFHVNKFEVYGAVSLKV